MNMNTGRFRTRRKCCHTKHNQTINDVLANKSFSCNADTQHQDVIKKYYKNYTNRGLEHLSYLEKKSCVIQKRKGLKKTTSFIKQDIPPVTNAAILAALSNF